VNSLHRLVRARSSFSSAHSRRSTMAKGKSKAATGPKDSSLSGEAGPASGLSSFLLGQAPAKDDALDDIFAHSVSSQTGTG
jgi:hypothetical protein